MKNSDRQNRFTKTFNPNSQVVFNLPLGGKIMAGRIILTGSVTLATTAAGTKMGAGGPTRLIERVKINANPASGPNGPRYAGGVIANCYPESLLRYAMRQRDGHYQAEQSGSTLGNGASGTYPIYESLPIYWANPRLKRKVQTALNADPTAYQSLQVFVSTADITNCFTGWGGTATYDLQVQWADDRENFAGDTYTVFMEDHDYEIPGTAQRKLDLAMPQDGAFESWDILALASAQETLSDALFDKLRLNGDAIDYEFYAQDIRQEAFDQKLIALNETATGLYPIDFADGLIGGDINAPGLQFNFDVTNVSGANLDKLRFFTRRLFQPVGMVQQGGAAAAKNS